MPELIITISNNQEKGSENNADICINHISPLAIECHQVVSHFMSLDMGSDPLLIWFLLKTYTELLTVTRTNFYVSLRRMFTSEKLSTIFARRA